MTTWTEAKIWKEIEKVRYDLARTHEPDKGPVPKSSGWSAEDVHVNSLRQLWTEISWLDAPGQLFSTLKYDSPTQQWGLGLVLVILWQNKRAIIETKTNKTPGVEN